MIGCSYDRPISKRAFSHLDDAKQEKSSGNQDGHAKLFASLIARTAKDIDFLIDSLPSEECSTELQVTLFYSLTENREGFKRVE